MDHLVFTSAVDLAAAIQSRQVSSVEVVQAYLRRIDEVNSRVNAVVQVAGDAALARARAADAALARGETWGPFHGVPFTAKDICDTAGIISAAGLEERRGFLPQADAVVVARLKTAGAILLGKTNVPPAGGGGWTDNPVYGRTNNPYNLACTVGGSSGGEAAAIAAGESPLGIGSDSGGSLRVPAHFCGIATLKPTTGRIPNTGVLELPGGLSDPRSQIGPMARYVRDLAAVFPLLAGVDATDSGVVPMPILDPAAVRQAGLRVAMYCDDGYASPTPETVAGVEAAGRALAGAGLAVTMARPACLVDTWHVTRRYWTMSRLTGAEVVGLFTDWDRFRTAMLQFMFDYDAILCPADYRPAGSHHEEADLRFSYTLPFSLSGWPCVVVRAGTSAQGLPIGVQIAAPPWREDIALAVAQVIEDALGGWRAPAL
jgi:amidase